MVSNEKKQHPIIKKYSVEGVDKLKAQSIIVHHIESGKIKPQATTPPSDNQSEIKNDNKK